ncbi:hypothetical protein AB1Y20_010216 [Prymnesium parvum]|uniref:Potassium channel domain-containing protein n=1 Tax=Prymnesium parvum TaxID=97485 RepID=A0AB34K8U7_PRYPA
MGWRRALAALLSLSLLSLSSAFLSLPTLVSAGSFLHQIPTHRVSHVLPLAVKGEDRRRPSPRLCVNSSPHALFALPNASTVARLLESPKVEVSLTVQVLISIVIFAFQTLPSVNGDTREALEMGEDLITFSFALEYVARWFAVSFKPSFLLTPIMLIDLISFAPTLFAPVPDNSFAFLRVLRTLRLQRFVADDASFRKFVLSLGLTPTVARPSQLQALRVAISVGTLLLVCAGMIYQIESGGNNQINDFFTALYFALTTITTVGFGDIVPVTTGGRLVVLSTILVGLAIVPAQLASLGEAFLYDNLPRDALQRSSANRAGESPVVASSGSSPDSLMNRRSAAPEMVDGKDSAIASSPPSSLYSSDASMAWALTCKQTFCQSCAQTMHPLQAAYCFKCGANLQSAPDVQ